MIFLNVHGKVSQGYCVWNFEALPSLVIPARAGYPREKQHV